jgi:hypothetical protein
MSSLYFICLNYIAEKEDFQLFFKKYYINALTYILSKTSNVYDIYAFENHIRSNKNNEYIIYPNLLNSEHIEYDFQTNTINIIKNTLYYIPNIEFKYIPKELLNYGLNEVILSDLFSLIYVKNQFGICMYYNSIFITNMDHFIYTFPGSIYLMHNYYLFHCESIYIKILLLNKFNIFVSEPFIDKITLMDYNIQKYNDKAVIKHYNLQNYNEYYVLHLFNKNKKIDL